MVDQNSPFLDRLWNALAGHGYIDGSTWETPQNLGQRPQLQAEGPPMPQQAPMPPRRPANLGVPQGNQFASLPGIPQGMSIPGSAPVLPQTFQPSFQGRMVSQADFSDGQQGPTPILAGGFSPQPSAFQLMLARLQQPRINQQIAGSFPSLGSNSFMR